ncbi:hypothetical protein DFH09DRAFT_1077280 [Mycena vulgaris]|nr:hypothetical protein DFH09DRAFT_1077280 [Mycena vulgaris]
MKYEDQIRVTELTKNFCAFECVDREIFQGSFSWIAACKHCPGSRELVLLEEFTELSVPATNPRNGSCFLTPTALARPHLIYPPNREFPQTVTKACFSQKKAAGRENTTYRVPANRDKRSCFSQKKAAGRHATPSEGQQRVCGGPPASRRCAAALNAHPTRSEITPVTTSPGARRRREAAPTSLPLWIAAPRATLYRRILKSKSMFSSSTKAAPHLQSSPAFPRRHGAALIPISRYIAIRERPNMAASEVLLFIAVVSHLRAFNPASGVETSHLFFRWKKAAGRHTPLLVGVGRVCTLPSHRGAAKRRQHRLHYVSPSRERRQIAAFFSPTQATGRHTLHACELARLRTRRPAAATPIQIFAARSLILTRHICSPRPMSCQRINSPPSHDSESSNFLLRPASTSIPSSSLFGLPHRTPTQRVPARDPPFLASTPGAPRTHHFPPFARLKFPKRHRHAISTTLGILNLRAAAPPSIPPSSNYMFGLPVTDLNTP